MVNIIKRFCRRNTYLNDWLYRHYRPGIEKVVKKTAEECAQIRALDNIDGLLTYKNHITEDGLPFWSYDLNATESRMYGIHSSLFKFITDRNIYFPSTEHGLILHNSNWSDTRDTSRASCITLGPFRKNILRRYYSTPIFCVGPYIAYASPILSVEEFTKEKAILGKNLLVFPTHGTDDADISYSSSCFIKKLHKLAADYNSVSVCCYWWNLDDPLISILKKEGYNILCAGYREDPLFLSRLRSIIELSDFVIGDNVGTHIGYCLNLNKPFSLFRSNTKKVERTDLGTDDSMFVQKHTHIIEEAFINASSITPEQISIYNDYWGGHCIKTPKEISSIYEINKEITLKCRGDIQKYPTMSFHLLKKYSQTDPVKFQLLKEALS